MDRLSDSVVGLALTFLTLAEHAIVRRVSKRWHDIDRRPVSHASRVVFPSRRGVGTQLFSVACPPTLTQAYVARASDLGWFSKLCPNLRSVWIDECDEFPVECQTLQKLEVLACGTGARTRAERFWRCMPSIKTVHIENASPVDALVAMQDTQAKIGLHINQHVGLFAYFNFEPCQTARIFSLVIEPPTYRRVDDLRLFQTMAEPGGTESLVDLEVAAPFHELAWNVIAARPPQLRKVVLRGMLCRTGAYAAAWKQLCDKAGAKLELS